MNFIPLLILLAVYFGVPLLLYLLFGATPWDGPEACQGQKTPIVRLWDWMHNR